MAVTGSAGQVQQTLNPYDDPEHDNLLRRVVYVASDQTRWDDFHWAQMQEDFLKLRKDDRYFDHTCNDIETSIRRYAGNRLSEKEISLITQRLVRSSSLVDGLNKVDPTTWEKLR